MAEVTLIDIPTQPTEFCWSPNTWKTRILLNYKGIPYDTEWVEYPDLADKLKGLGIPPNDPDEIAPYTAPSVIFKSDGKSFMESFSIAAEINKRYPNPPLPCDTQIQAKASECIQKLFACVVAELIPRVPSILPPRSAEYFHETRKDRFGMSLEDFANEKGGLKCWGAAEEPLKQLAGLLKENDSGPFFEGEQVTFADFKLASLFRFVEILNSVGFDRIMKTDPAMMDLYDACKPWMRRDSH